MEQRRHRVAVLLLVVALHVPALLALRDWLKPPEGRPERALVVEFVTVEASAPPPPSPRRRVRERERERERGEPVARAPAARPSPPSAPKAVEPAVHPRDQPVRLYSGDGSLRIASDLAAQVAAAPANEASNTFHIPAGDTWVLREPAPPIEFRDTMFSRVFLPEGMNPIEEACWRNKGLAFVLTMLGSRDCAAPGQQSKVPPPALIVYGVDDGDEILRKTSAWSRYNER